MMQKGNSTVIMVVVAVMVFGLVGLLAYKGFGIGTSVVDEGKNVVEKVTGSGDAQTDALNSQSDSDEIDAIERDLNNTSLDEIDSELGDIAKYLNSL